MAVTHFTDEANYDEDRPVPAPLSANLEPLSQRSDVGELWRNLESRSDCSFFQSWAWIGCWLRHLPSNLTPRVLAISVGSKTVGLGIINARQHIRHGWLRTNTLHLNEIGDDHFDSIAIEYNGFLSDRDFGTPCIARSCVNWLIEHEYGWDELSLGGLDAEATETLEKIAFQAGLGTWARAEERCDCVDLSDLRQIGGGYLSSISRNTRYQIRRAIRLYEEAGPLSVIAAGSATEALVFLDELSELHQAAWMQRGHSGAFANDFYRCFHRDLIMSRFEAAEIQLLRVSAGPRTIGYLYNLVSDGTVHAYQSGFRFDADPRLKPGLVSHYLAIQYNLKVGKKIYDFMAGESQYKTSLGTRTTKMTWLVLYHKVAKLQVENALRRIKAQLRPNSL